jgi:hypothetical protein
MWAGVSAENLRRSSVNTAEDVRILSLLQKSNAEQIDQNHYHWVTHNLENEIDALLPVANDYLSNRKSLGWRLQDLWFGDMTTVCFPRDLPCVVQYRKTHPPIWDHGTFEVVMRNYADETDLSRIFSPNFDKVVPPILPKVNLSVTIDPNAKKYTITLNNTSKDSVRYYDTAFHINYYFDVPWFTTIFVRDYNTKARKTVGNGWTPWILWSSLAVLPDVVSQIDSGRTIEASYDINKILVGMRIDDINLWLRGTEVKIETALFLDRGFRKSIKGESAWVVIQ